MLLESRAASVSGKRRNALRGAAGGALFFLSPVPRFCYNPPCSRDRQPPGVRAGGQTNLSQTRRRRFGKRRNFLDGAALRACARNRARPALRPPQASYGLPKDGDPGPRAFVFTGQQQQPITEKDCRWLGIQPCESSKTKRTNRWPASCCKTPSKSTSSHVTLIETHYENHSHDFVDFGPAASSGDGCSFHWG